MKSPRAPHSSGHHIMVDDVAWRPSWGYLLIALGLAAGGLGYWWLSDTVPAESSQTAAASSAAASASSNEAWPIQASVPVSQSPAVVHEAHVDRDADQDPTPDLSSYVPRGENPTMNQVIERLHQAGIYTGLGAFNPPGTRPPKIGLAVPEGYPLPDGYVRHYQATDDGQRIEPILMFAPDREIRDANGRPIKVPEDHVVTPELAPPGFPLRRITIPAPLDAGRGNP